MRKNFKSRGKQKGFSLVQLGITIVISVILGILAIPKFKEYLISGRIPSVGEDLQRYIANIVATSSGNGTTPYTGLDQQAFARAMRGTSLDVDTGSTTVRHNLGGGTSGNLVLGETGDSFTITANNVSSDACPGFATTMQRIVDDISINGSSAKVTATDKTITTAYSAAAAANECTDGDTNTFVFTIR